VSSERAFNDMLFPVWHNRNKHTPSLPRWHSEEFREMIVEVLQLRGGGLPRARCGVCGVSHTLAKVSLPD
jgi:hypothetical protein